MAITSSQIIEDRVQIDGRRHVTEEHITDGGKVLHVFYLAESGEDELVVMAARVKSLEDQVQAEVDAKDKSIRMDSIIEKENLYYLSLSDAELKIVLGLTDEEVILFREVKASG